MARPSLTGGGGPCPGPGGRRPSARPRQVVAAHQPRSPAVPPGPPGRCAPAWRPSSGSGGHCGRGCGEAWGRGWGWHGARTQGRRVQTYPARPPRSPCGPRPGRSQLHTCRCQLGLAAGDSAGGGHPGRPRRVPHCSLWDRAVWQDLTHSDPPPRCHSWAQTQMPCDPPKRVPDSQAWEDPRTP